MHENDLGVKSISKEDLENCKNDKESFRPEIIDKILSYHNGKTAMKLFKQAEETYKGQRLNELCDHYHSTYKPSGSKGATVKMWPRPGLEHNDNLLSDFIASQENSSEKIEDFKLKLKPPLFYRSKYPYSLGISPETTPPKQVAFLVDYSGSMRREISGSTLMKQAIDNVLAVFVDYILDIDSVSFALFDHEYKPVFHMSNKSANMYDLIKNCPQPKRGGTAFFDSLIETISDIPDTASNIWVIALTDGEDVHSKKTLSDCINLVKQSDINLFLIGFMVNSKVADTLNSITREVSKNYIGKYITASDKEALDEAFEEISVLMEGPVMLT